MIRFSRNIEQRKQIYSSKANALGVAWCSYNERTHRLRVYRRLLANHLHGKAAELCLANSWNNSITTTKYIEYIKGQLKWKIHIMFYKLDLLV